MSNRASRACDPCRFRKVKCNGSNPCAQCGHLNLSCIYSPAPSKRKPGVRGRLVAQLRQGTKTRPARSSPEAVEAPAQPLPCPSAFGSTYSADFFLRLVPDFETVVFPVNPIILPSEIVAAVGNMDHSFEDSALVHAFAAVTINLAQLSRGFNEEVAARVSDLMRHSFRLHRQAEMGTDVLGRLPITVKRIMTCIFLEICFMAFKRWDRGLTILREATAMIQMLEMDQINDGLSDHETATRQRLYWEASIHERFLTIVAGPPSILPPLSGLPPTDPELPLHINTGFDRLISLFLILDDTFLSHWRAQQDPRHEAPEMTAEWIESKQAQLDQDEIGAAETERALICSGCGGLTELQHADLFITRLWLRTLVWQLALSEGLLQSTPPKNSHEGLSMHFPAERLSDQLRSLVSRLHTVESIGIHGSGIFQKLFEITSTVADVLALPIAQDQNMQAAESRIDGFLFLVKFVLGFERIPAEQKDYLREKVNTLQKVHAAFDFESLRVCDLVQYEEQT
ncbi:hypothetical protein FZEAL_8532 [Fusarium zealandicum]|uniref:Zn(2)-C6 fungal-type domain-containing protein n=1 Tax=Fusarium zealandicum TaxID=1053134 RepID=A0A8H4XHS6_9HYPO|nr:hypothetical protein FZEAL_8532 [Fusarium zealandicum]